MKIAIITSSKDPASLNIRNQLMELFKLDETEELFEEMKQDQVINKEGNLQFLSMGMTNDYKIAIEEGSNMIRIGRAIFHYE